MSKLILLDAGPLGLLSHSNASLPLVQAARAWMERHKQQGNLLIVPEITDYEVRRELLRADLFKGLHRLDLLQTTISYLPLNTQVMLRAAQLWAQARKQGYPTASDAALDGDVILAAQTAILLEEGNDAIVATTNPKHLSRFVPASDWQTL
jgi:predicted nucleic acid-binding protein